MGCLQREGHEWHVFGCDIFQTTTLWEYVGAFTGKENYYVCGSISPTACTLTTVVSVFSPQSREELKKDVGAYLKVSKQRAVFLRKRMLLRFR